MTDIDGIYDCVSKSPMGEQQSELFLVNENGQYSATIILMGERLTLDDLIVSQGEMKWRMTVNQPFVIPLQGRATIDGQHLQGTIDAGPFGIFAVAGQKRV